MKIISIATKRISIPLKRPFKTAIRTATHADAVLVKVNTDTGMCGFGEAVATPAITGETQDSIECAINSIIAPNIIGYDINDIEDIMIKLNSCIIKNTSAKAAVDIAIYDLFGKLHNAPLCNLLGGNKKTIDTDVTISVNSIDEMVKDSVDAVDEGFNILKIKVGKGGEEDIERIAKIRDAVGKDVLIRVDANQGWGAKQAVKIITALEDKNLNIELVEQPLAAHDLEGMQYVTKNVYTPILADECVFSPQDAVKVLQMHCADLLNIKLMKTGGIYNALKICSVAEIYGVECMIGCMLETGLAISAAVQLAAAKACITKADLDGPSLCQFNPYVGHEFNAGKIILNNNYGIGVDDLQNF